MSSETSAPLVVVMGAAGCGKTTIGEVLAQRLCTPFLDAHDLHAPANLAKMSRGIGLTDQDRDPWLRSIGERLADHAPSGLVVACSALRLAYRDVLRTYAPDTAFVHLRVPRGVITTRLATRHGHVRPLSLVDSQLRTLEDLAPHERGATFDADRRVDHIVDDAFDALRSPHPPANAARPGLVTR